MRLTDQIGVQRDAHDRRTAALFRFLRQPFELPDQCVGIVARAHIIDEKAVMVVDLEAVGNGDEAAAARLYRLHLVVMIKVAGIVEPIFGDEVERARRMRQRRRQPAANGLASRVPHRPDRILYDRAFLRLRHAIGIAGVINAVAEKLPPAGVGVGDHFGVVLTQRDRQRHRTGKAMFGHHIRHAPVRHPVAMVAVAVPDDIGVGPRPCPPLRVGGRINLIIFEVGCNPYCNPFAPRPGQRRPAAIGRIVVQTGIRRPFVHQRASSQSTTACTGSTSAYFSCRSVRFAK